MNYDLKTKKLRKSEVEIEVSLPADFLVSARKKALEKMRANLEIDGFRKGNVPEAMVLEKIGDKVLLEEAADIILNEHFPKIVTQEKLDVIGRPNIQITKLALDNPFEFKVVVAVLPEFELLDYKSVAKAQSASLKVEEPEATEKEVEEVLLQIRKNKAHFDWHKANPEDKGHDHPNLDLEKEENLPTIDDDFAKQAGNFKNVEELKEKVKQNIMEEKKFRNIEKKRALIMDELLRQTPIELPEILIESEINKSIAQMKDDVARAGGKFEDYLKHVKKSEEDLRKDLRDSSEKKAKIQLIFNKIAEAEKLEPNKEILENEVKKIIELYPDASPESARIYVSTLLLNQEVLKLLES